MPGKWVKAAEAATYFSIPPKTLYSLAGRHLLPPGRTLRLGRGLRFNLEAIEAGGISKEKKAERDRDSGQVPNRGGPARPLTIKGREDGG
jgi:hypothetical protein